MCVCGELRWQGGKAMENQLSVPRFFLFIYSSGEEELSGFHCWFFFFNFYFTACDLVLISFHPKIFFSFSLCFCAAPLHIACSSFPKRISGKTGFSPDLFLSRFSSKSIIRYLMRYFYCGAFLFLRKSGAEPAKPSQNENKEICHNMFDIVKEEEEEERGRRASVLKTSSIMVFRTRLFTCDGLVTSTRAHFFFRKKVVPTEETAVMKRNGKWIDLLQERRSSVQKTY